VDGIFGRETEVAVKAFQRSRALVPDGIVGTRTWPKLVLRVKSGSRGDAVRAVQEVISFHHQLDAPHPAIDGIFGLRTDAWIRGFQRAVGITPDGIVGLVTWRALVSGMLSG
jgi:peptidoglycan hydrolase-like protein with peptidoglycan-binding domain